MSKPCWLGRGLSRSLAAGLIALLCVGPLLRRAEAAEADTQGGNSAAAVPLAERPWRAVAATSRAPVPAPTTDFVRTGLPPTDRGTRNTWVHTSAETMAAYSGSVCCPIEDPCADRFRFTVIRAWLFRSFVPDKSDPDTFGLEFDSSWGWGSFDVSNISYFEVADYPQAVPGQPVGNPVPGVGAATGVGDFLSAVLFSKKKGGHHGPHHFAYGFACQLPTASDDTLGSGKWSVGPAIEYEYECGRFYAALVALQLWSVAGDSDRKDVAMLMIKPMITYELSRRWKAVYMPYGITVYWNKPSGNRTYVPLGGGLQYGFKIGSQDMAVSAQLFNYVARPSKGTEWDLRFMLEFDF